MCSCTPQAQVVSRRQRNDRFVSQSFQLPGSVDCVLTLLAESFAVFAAVRSHLRDDFAPNDREVCNNAVNQLGLRTPWLNSFCTCLENPCKILAISSTWEHSIIVLRCSGHCRVCWGWRDTPDCRIVCISDKVAVHSS